MGTIADRVAFLTSDPGARQLATFLEEQIVRIDSCCGRGSSVAAGTPNALSTVPLHGDASAKTTAT